MPERSVRSRQWRGASGSSEPPLSTVTCTSRTSPREPSSSRRRTVFQLLKSKGAGTSWATSSGRASEAASMSRASLAFMPMRASQRTCLPASRAATVRSRCMYGQVPMQTASMSSAARRVAVSGSTRGMPYASAMARPLASLRLQTETSSTSPVSWKPGMWRSFMLPPAPMRPIRRGASFEVMGCSLWKVYGSIRSARNEHISGRRRRQRPCQRAGRFSEKARGPSFASSELRTARLTHSPVR